MINVLVADDNINFITNLINYINRNNDNIRIYAIATDGEETIKILNNSDNIDIILLDLKMPNCGGKEVLEKIENKNRYEKSFIIISGEINLIQDIDNNEMIYTVIHKVSNMEEIILKINEVIENKEKIKSDKILSKKIINELLYLGYDISYKGTKYLAMAIEYIVKNQKENLENLEKEIYPIISKKCNQTVHNIKCNINRANNAMYYECEVEKLKKYFCFSKDTKPKIKTVINTIINKLNCTSYNVEKKITKDTKR